MWFAASTCRVLPELSHSPEPWSEQANRFFQVFLPKFQPSTLDLPSLLSRFPLVRDLELPCVSIDTILVSKAPWPH